MKLGLEQKILHFEYSQRWDEGLVDVNRHRQYSTIYMSSIWKPTILWNIETGVRLNYFNSDKNFTNFEPRIAVKYRISESSNLKAAYGRYHQYLNRIPRLFFSSIWSTADQYTNESKSEHFILGFQKDIGGFLEFQIEAYYKSYNDIYAFNPVFNAEVAPDAYDSEGKAIYRTTNSLFMKGDGKSYGIELLLRKSAGALNGWLSYAYSKTLNTYANINQGEEFSPRHDRTSVINFVANANLNNIFSGNFNGKMIKSDKNWSIGLNFIYATGQPLTVPASAYYTNTFPDWDDINFSGENNPNYNLYPGKINSYRLPEYIRLDLNVNYEIDYGSWTLTPYLQIFNIGNRKNVWFIDYLEEFNDGTVLQKVDKTNMLPILPSIGVKIEF